MGVGETIAVGMTVDGIVLGKVGGGTVIITIMVARSLAGLRAVSSAVSLPAQSTIADRATTRLRLASAGMSAVPLKISMITDITTRECAFAIDQLSS